MALQAQVLYEYEAQDGDQLTVKPGDVLEIIDDSPNLNGWALARMGEKEGYVPAEYVRYIDQQQPYDYGDTWQPAGFETYYQNALSQDHRLPFSIKLVSAARDVMVPCPCSRFGYTMSRPDLKRGAILHLVFAFIVSLVDAFTIIAPTLSFDADDNSGPSNGQMIATGINALGRVLLTMWFIKRYPRPSLTFATFPFLNVIGSLTYSIRVYELLEMGDNKEYDGYRYNRGWMFSSLLNVPFTIVGLLLVIFGSPGLIAVSVLVLVWNLLNVGKCFLSSWAAVESGNDIHPDFESTIKRYQL